MSERQPLLGGGSSGSGSSSHLPLRPLHSNVKESRKFSLADTANEAIIADFKQKVPARIRVILLRKAAKIKEKRKFKKFNGESDDESELANIIAHTPDLEAIFDSVSGRASTRHSEQSSLIASTVASSYGTLQPTSTRHRLQLSKDTSNDDSKSSAQRPPSTTNRRATTASIIPINPDDDDDSLDDDDFQSNELFEELTNPVGKYRRVWLLIIFLFVLWNALIVPFMLAFQTLWHDIHLVIILLSVCYIGDLFFCLDVALYFFTPYTREDGYSGRDLADIRSHYFRTWFVPDLISSFPFDLFLLPWGLRAVLLARMTRFLRFWKYDSYFEIWEQYSTRYPQGIRFSKLMLGLMLILHWLACFWFYCGQEYGFGVTTWLPGYEFKHADITSQYIVAIWWSTNIITQVGGDPGLPTTNFERMADFFVAFIAVFVVAMVIGNVTELVSELSVEEGELRNKLSILNHFMYARRLPDELQERIRTYYFTLWNRRGVTDGDTAILGELPSNLRTEVSLIMNQDILGKVPIFQSSSPGFINSLVLHLKPQTFTPKEIIVKQGDLGSELYFISRGQVIVIVNDKTVGRIGEGGYFGEIAGIRGNALRTATIIAQQFVDVFVLSHQDLQSLFSFFPREKDIIMHVAETRKAKDLLRKTLTDPTLLIREQMASGEAHHGMGAFENHPVLVNLLIELFQPLDLIKLFEHNSCLRKHTISPAPSPNTANATPTTHTHAPRPITLEMDGLRIDSDGEIIDLEDGHRTTSTNSPVDSDAETDIIEDPHQHHEFELDDAGQEGVIFSPADESQTIYFIGKGCIDIFVHPEVVHDHDECKAERIEHGDTMTSHPEDSSDEVRSNRGGSSHHSSEHGGSDNEEDMPSEACFNGQSIPEHVIRLTEGHFFGAIANEHYRVSAVVPQEYRATAGENQAIIFALTSYDLSKLHEYYMSLPDDDEDEEINDIRLHLKRALVTFLQRHRTPVDYIRSMLNPVLTMNLDPEDSQSTNWKGVLRKIVTRRRQQPPSTNTSVISEKKPVLTHAFTVHQTRRKQRSDDTDEEEEQETVNTTNMEKTNSKPLITISPASSPPTIVVEPYTSANWQVAASAATTVDPIPQVIPTTTSKKSVSPAAIITQFQSPTTIAQQQAAAAAASTTTTSGAATAAGVSVTSPGSAGGSGRPPLHRAASMGTNIRSPELRGADAALSPLLQRARQIQIRTASTTGGRVTGETATATTKDVSELLADADMSENARHPSLERQHTRIPSLDRPPTGLTLAAPTATTGSTILTPSSASSANAAAQPPPSNSANLEWLVSTSAPPPSEPGKDLTRYHSARSVLSPPVAATQVLTPKPEMTRRIPSVPIAAHPVQPTAPQRLLGGRTSSQAIQAQQTALSSGMSMAGGGMMPPLSVRGGHRGSIFYPPGGPIGPQQQPFSFLLALPQQSQSMVNPFGSNLPPMSPSLLTSQSAYHPATSVSGNLMSPVAATSFYSPRGPLEQKRGSGSTIPTPSSRRPSIQPNSLKSRVEFIEKSLAALSSEDLLLMSNIINQRLYARMQQAIQQTNEVAAHAQAQAAAHHPTASASIVTPQPRF